MLVNAIVLSALVLAIVYGSRILERKWPIAAIPQSEFQDDWLAVIVTLGLTYALNPLTSVSSAAILNYTGVGWIHLPTDGYWYWMTMVIVILVMDLYKYSVHRLRHVVPIFWELHSFHHSANALTFITGARHLWIERVIDNAFLPVLAIFFQIPVEMATTIGLIFFIPDGCAHLNVRFPMGRFITWINTPQWHRIHHSVQPEHHDKNFAALLPLWDILLGTACIPAPDEYPDTGLMPKEHADLLNTIIWPFRHLRRKHAVG